MALVEPGAYSAAAVRDIETCLREVGARKLAIIGVGNSLRGDDFAGSFVVKKLASKSRGGVNQPLVLDAEGAPENFTEKIRAFGANVVIFIDCALMGSPPGSVKVVSLKGTGYPFFSTHNLPLKLLDAAMGRPEDSYLIGIEPKTTGFCEAMSEEVRVSCILVAQAIRNVVTEWS